MRILNLGSLNFDKVYAVEHFAAAGETLLSRGYAEFLGGKGLNQSLALARAGAEVFHAGAVGPDGAFASIPHLGGGFEVQRGESPMKKIPVIID